MFYNHGFSGYDSIELYVLLQQPNESQVVDPIEVEQAEVDVIDEDEEDPELAFDDMVNDESEEDVEGVIPPISTYTPPSHMSNVDMAGDEPSSDIFHNVCMQSDATLKEKDSFRSKDECMQAIKKFHMLNSMDFKVDRTNAERYKIKCTNTECLFKLTASYRLRSDSWVIGKISQPHTCINSSRSQDHRKLSYDLICQEILPLINNDPSLKVRTIISHITKVYNYTPSYRKAWLAKTKAIEQVYGNWEESYKELPRYLNALCTYAPGTVYEMETLPAYAPNGTLVSGNGIFRRLFWAFQPCIRGFAFCKPIIQIDGTWLYGKYKGTLLMAVAQDGNSNVFPIAFALVDGETGGGWSFFLKNLRTHVAPQAGLCLISDRHASIVSAYNNPDNGWHDPLSTHVFCIRHIVQNFTREIKDRALRKLVMNAGYALTQPSFKHYRREIRLSNPDAGTWIDNIPVEKWTRSYDNGHRWGHMTTNLVESMNGVFKGIRHLPVTALVKSTYFRMASLFAQRGERWDAVLRAGQLWSECCTRFIKAEGAKANTHMVTRFDRHNQNFMVRETIDHGEGLPRQEYRVLLEERWCDCGKFQAFRMPCSHVIATCAHSHLDALALLSPIYKFETLLHVYNNGFAVVAKEDYWPAYEGEIVWHNDQMRRNKKGRPKSKRITTEMDELNKLERKCGLCRQVGHNKKNCPNHASGS
ncbi:uncharacterized protein LOC131621962 [Vicia villosa]|uniref:uncharacterized protein LOC131621962 n=1 Tax=Vicia villosa TaxID=3911 RepID=UPI00273AA79B|nr:uncharacterized protein LOC131621962 [Vicia villosa]